MSVGARAGEGTWVIAEQLADRPVSLCTGCSAHYPAQRHPCTLRGCQHEDDQCQENYIDPCLHFAGVVPLSRRIGPGRWEAGSLASEGKMLHWVVQRIYKRFKVKRSQVEVFYR